MTKERLQQILISARKEKDLTHEEVASLAKTSITRQYYGMIESGKRIPSVDIAKSIADVLDVEWTIFFDVKCNQSLQCDEQAI